MCPVLYIDYRLMRRRCTWVCSALLNMYMFRLFASYRNIHMKVSGICFIIEGS